MRNAKGRKVESYSRIKDGNGRLVQREDDMRRTWNEYFEYLYSIDTLEQVAVHMCGFDGIRVANYFRGEPVGKAEVAVGVWKLKKGKAAGKDEITGEMEKMEVTEW